MTFTIIPSVATGELARSVAPVGLQASLSQRFGCLGDGPARLISLLAQIAELPSQPSEVECAALPVLAGVRSGQAPGSACESL
jgi:hypothetical protein